VDETAVSLLIAVPPTASSEEPEYGRLSIPPSSFELWSLDDHSHEVSTGRFVKLAYHGDDETLSIRVHPNRRCLDPDLPLLFPDPARYRRTKPKI